MDKTQAINKINQNTKDNSLNSKNTHFSNIVNYQNSEGWWLNIPFKKFSDDLNLILNDEEDNNFIHIKITANTILNPKSIFRNKEDKADIFIPKSDRKNYFDNQSNGTGYTFINFKDYSYTKRKKYTEEDLTFLSKEIFNIYINKYIKNENLQYSIMQPSSNKKIIHNIAKKLGMSTGTAENYSERLFNLWNKLNRFNIHNGLEDCPKLLEKVGNIVFDKKYFVKKNILNSITFNKVLDEKISKSKKTSKESRKQRLLNSSKLPSKVEVVSTQYNRNPDVIAEILERANGFCEICKKEAPFLKKKDKTPYLEVHHIIKLADGGEDTVENAIGVCPNCHRELHFG